MIQSVKPITNSHRILIVDDDELAVESLRMVLRAGGYSDVSFTTDPRRVLPLFREFAPDLVLLDLRMPGLDGFAVIRQISVRIPEGQFLPIVVVSGDLASETKQRALALGACDFIEKPYEAGEIRLRLRNLLRTRDLTARLEERVQERTRDLQAAEIEVASRLALAAELRDYRDGAHVQRVGVVSALIAERLGLPQAQVALIRHAAPLHDIGKIAVPDAILLKSDALSLEEWDVMKTHTTVGARMLAGSRSPILQLAEEIALYHHENWDGTGYTPGLEGEDIPVVGRIVAVADVFDALTHARPYKQAWSRAEAVDWMETMRAHKFDPAALDALISVLDDDIVLDDEFAAESAGAALEPLPLL
jgi:putative two-component system response regulator